MDLTGGAESGTRSGQSLHLGEITGSPNSNSFHS